MAPRLSITYPAADRAPGAARRWLRAALPLGHPQEDAALLLLSEAVTNAVQHAADPRHGQVTVGAELDGDRLQIEVLDDGFGRDSPHIVHDLDSECGRGVQLINAIAKDWRYEILADGRGRLHFTL